MVGHAKLSAFTVRSFCIERSVGVVYLPLSIGLCYLIVPRRVSKKKKVDTFCTIVCERYKCDTLWGQRWTSEAEEDSEVDGWYLVPNEENKGVFVIVMGY